MQSIKPAHWPHKHTPSTATHAIEGLKLQSTTADDTLLFESQSRQQPVLDPQFVEDINIKVQSSLCMANNQDRSQDSKSNILCQNKKASKSKTDNKVSEPNDDL